MLDSPWFVSRAAGGPRELTVFCFPHAGGNARTFLGWQQHLATEAQLVGVTMPGRGLRHAEPAPASVAELADRAAEAIAAAVDHRPFYLLGHSFGAILAFEVARRLRDLPGLRRLIASGCSAPVLLPTDRVVRTARLTGQAFTEAVGFFGGLPPEVVADEELQDLLLPGLRADFRLVAGYRYRPAAPLPIEVALINGRDDPHIGAAELRLWERECEGLPRYHWADGGHFYFEPDPAPIVDLVRSLIRSDSGAARHLDEHIELI
ncbi:surfactin synthase thioesterase subunit [Kitasatospora sp. MAP12-15]|uniref:thioesterase II family protein n=1 Tax=unclassified Kitasatospora TaxID=2633591 RepID=UPI0024751D1A|nr:alpha/beta fold hydrolase [Kitasatospora sp. MAP12-44]MDH6110339.1 surfactin synthase thioesterase subunit [Kitasatospora sp. MAP12-44]